MATEKRLIDANALMAMFKKDYCQYCDSYNGILCRSCWLDNVDIAVDAQPTVDAVEVVHGRWKSYHEADIGYDEYGVRCSNCEFEVEDHEVKFIMHYCPNCGAKMDGDGNGT